VYNEVARIKKWLNGLTPVKALLLTDDDWAVWYPVDIIRHVNFLFAHDEAIELPHENPDVILIDATYRTTRYNMPLLNFIAVTAIDELLALRCASFLQRTRPGAAKQSKPSKN
jgi:hypothetical protein